MPNSIRTPRTGTTAHARAIAEAVDDEDWQKFRVSLKGRTTIEKVERLKEYFLCEMHVLGRAVDRQKVRRQVDNYLKALARGGLIVAEGPSDYITKLITDGIQIIR